jgi:hypothetical protein
MMRCNQFIPEDSGGTMPNFELISVEDAKLHTIPVSQRQYMNEYAGYIQQLSHGKAGMLHLLEMKNQPPYDGDLLLLLRLSAPSW